MRRVDPWPLIAHAHAIDSAGIGLRLKLLRNGPELLLQFTQADSWAQERAVKGDLFNSEAVDLLLPLCRLRRPAMRRAGNIAEIPHWADHFGVEADKVTILDPAQRRLLQPRIYPRP